MTHTMTRRTAGRRRTALALPLCVATAVVLAGCADDEPDESPDGTPETTATQEEPAESRSAEQTDLAALIAGPASYDDRFVSVRGVADNHGPGVFSLVPEGGAGAATDDPSDGVDGLVVFHELGDGPADGDTVTVTGEVNDTFDVAAVEEALETDIADDLVSTLGLGEQDVVLIADTVTPA
jgi:hypothetical protein